MIADGRRHGVRTPSLPLWSAHPLLRTRVRLRAMMLPDRQTWSPHPVPPSTRPGTITLFFNGCRINFVEGGANGIGSIWRDSGVKPFCVRPHRVTGSLSDLNGFLPRGADRLWSALVGLGCKVVLRQEVWLPCRVGVITWGYLLFLLRIRHSVFGGSRGRWRG